MAKNMCILYQGIFNGVLEEIGIDTDGNEVKCSLLGDDACTFKYDLLVDEFGSEDVDKEEKSPQISEFMKSL